MHLNSNSLPVIIRKEALNLVSEPKNIHPQLETGLFSFTRHIKSALDTIDMMADFISGHDDIFRKRQRYVAKILTETRERRMTEQRALAETSLKLADEKHDIMTEGSRDYWSQIVNNEHAHRVTKNLADFMERAGLERGVAKENFEPEGLAPCDKERSVIAERLILEVVKFAEHCVHFSENQIGAFFQHFTIECPKRKSPSPVVLYAQEVMRDFQNIDGAILSIRKNIPVEKTPHLAQLIEASAFSLAVPFEADRQNPRFPTKTCSPA